MFYRTELKSHFNLFQRSEQVFFHYSGKQTTAFSATLLWHNIPIDLKDLNVFNLCKKLKPYLLSEQRFQSLSLLLRKILYLDLYLTFNLYL